MLKTKIDKYDQTFSKFIRLRDGICQRCGKAGRLECSHIFSRKHQGTRYDPANAKALCFSCHRWWHENPVEAVEWLLTIVGRDAYDKLRLKANRVTKLTQSDRDYIRAEHEQNIKAMQAGAVLSMFNKKFSQYRPSA